MIETKTIDLYHQFGLERGNASGGHLMCWIWDTPKQICPWRRKRPAVLILPGGGYSHVSAREAEPVAFRFMARGYAAFVLDYSVSPSIFPTALREAAMAMRHIRDHAEQYEVNEATVAAVGFSAGGHLCGTLGTMFDAPEIADIGPSEIIRPDALGLCYPVAVSWGNTHEESFANLTNNDPYLRSKLSLDHLVRQDMPPVFLWHTRNDQSVPVRNSLILSQALDEAGVHFSMYIYRNGPHGISLANEQCYHTCHIPEHSIDITNWPETMMAFFSEEGFKIIDEELQL